MGLRIREIDGVRGGVENEPVTRRGVAIGPDRVRGAPRRVGAGPAAAACCGLDSLPDEGGMIRRTRSATPVDMASIDGAVSVKLVAHSPL